MKKIGITGANGFIGKSLCKALHKLNKPVVAIVRSENSIKTLSGINTRVIGNITPNTNWSQALENCEVIIHCAAKADAMNSKDNFDDYYAVNADGTKNLAEQAVEAGVKKLIFLSSIKVNGENTDKKIFDNNLNNEKNLKFRHDHLPNPDGYYAKSKFEAEKMLWNISLKTGLEVIVFRLPLVYGPGVRGNIARLIKIINLGLPLPLSGIKNKRSILGIDNLVDLLIHSIHHSKASGKIFLASDDQDLSTPELIKIIAFSLGRKANLFPFPISMLKFLTSVLGKREEINRLVGSLRIDDSYTKEILNWTPSVSVEEGIRRMVQGK